MQINGLVMTVEGGKRVFVAIAFTAITLTGCNSPLSTPSLMEGGERRIAGSKKAAATTKTSAKPLQAGPGSTFKSPALASPGSAATKTSTGAPATQAGGKQGVATAAPSMAQLAVPATGAAGAGPAQVAMSSANGSAATKAAVSGLRLVARPDLTVRAITIRDGYDELVDAHFQPEAGFTAWEIQAPEAGVAVSKVKFTFKGAGEAVTAELPPADLEMPAQLRGTASVKIPFGLVQTIDAIAASTENADIRASVMFLDAAGQPLKDVDGSDFTLTTTISVL